MRPKKLILVIDPNDTDLSITIFALLTGGFAAAGVHTIEEANEFLKTRTPNTVLFNTKFLGDHACTELPRVTRTLSMTVEELRTRLRITAEGKRGPKPKTEMPPQIRPC